MLKNYDIVIGLEIHAELNTKTKLMCGCSNAFGSEPNTNCCPACLGMPGAVPSINKAAVEKTIRAGLAMGCEINDVAIFERKHYFYPDLPAGFQTSQLVKPICIGGGIKLKSGKFIRLNRIHLEEDAAKLVHTARSTLVDCNRGGVPLNEIVTEPDFSSSEEVVEFLEEVRNRLIFAEVADCKMEEGGMRCDVNLSLKPKGSTTLGSRTEMKNLASFKSVVRAIEYESQRQAEILDSGKEVAVETRGWNDERGTTVGQRSKEQAHDYCYFEAPDLPYVEISREEVENIKKDMPMMPQQLREVLLTNGLSEYEFGVLLSDSEMAKYYLSLIKRFNNYKVVSTWVLNDLAGIKKANTIEANPSVDELVYIIKLVDEKKITRVNGVELLKELVINNVNPEKLVKEKGLLEGVSDNVIIDIIKKVLAEKPNLVTDYKENPQKVSPFIIGQVMKATQGKAKSDIVIKLIDSLLK